MFQVLRLFVREKLRDRVFTVSIPQVMEGVVEGMENVKVVEEMEESVEMKEV